MQHGPSPVPTVTAVRLDFLLVGSVPYLIRASYAREHRLFRGRINTAISGPVALISTDSRVARTGYPFIRQELTYAKRGQSQGDFQR